MLLPMNSPISPSLPLEQPVVIVDLETTGGSPLYHRIIEVGVIRLEPGKAPVRFSSLVAPGRYVPPFILHLTGIRQEKLDQAPRFEELALELQDLLKDAIFVAHNARFDYAFLKGEFERLGISFSARTLCSARFSRALYPEHRRHNLSILIERHGLKMENRHRALDDALAVHEFLEKAWRDRPGAFEKTWKHFLESRRLQTQIPQARFEALPEGPGVYLFYGEKRQLLYVGKSRNIKHRVMSHFYSDYESGSRLSMTGQVLDVEALPTAGEFSALMLESRLIKERLPLFNRRLRRESQLVFALRRENAQGYFTVVLERRPNCLVPGEPVLGIFRNLKKAKEALTAIAYESELCQIVMGLEKARNRTDQTACFGWHIKKCRGACTGKEIPAAWNTRFLSAFQETLPRPWPYAGPVMIEEFDRKSGIGEAWLIDDWQIRAAIRSPDGEAEVETWPGGLDLESYKILDRVFRDPYSGTRIRPLTRAKAAQFLDHPAIEL